ncbi:FMN-binding negative transcriptional regulator [Rhodobacteraceae bacterium 2CG4]|uniref:FMN-binding negative transcriptional regulator n=1 Tax=Halovulum marinum TaxID=2662447 RepID=A0A6L5Z3G7_9RHOB|nr:FMN-binding negative transcriptional regulator [Halovulum marinum]MSU90615.1 FMN-binding negative transcriptional regulator [Halovulum marinum]
MHPNSAFRRQDAAHNLAFARARGFGVLTVAGPDGPLAAHVPFVLSADGQRWEAHLVRSNPVLRALPAQALVVVSGPDGYVSPDWYGLPDQVPTWNYVAVHLRGRLAALPPADLPPHAARLAAEFEARLAPKPPWTEAKMDPEALTRLRRMIVPVAMRVTAVEGTWKLNQNKPDNARQGAAARICDGTGAELAALAALMRRPPPTA